MGKYINSIIKFVILDTFLIEATDPGYESGLTHDGANPGKQSSDGLFNKLFLQNLEALRQGSPHKQGAPQQYAGVPQGLDEYLKMQRQGSDTYYEPYWKGGEWVFYRKPFTTRPPKYMQYYKKVKPEIVAKCVENCPKIYAGFGPLCAHYTSLNYWDGNLKQKTFFNLCHMEFDSCINSMTRHWNERWRPSYKGNCVTRWKPLEVWSSNLLSNAKKYVDALMTTQEPITEGILKGIGKG